MIAGVKRRHAAPLKTAAGHLKAVERMVEADKYCADVFLQLQVPPWKNQQHYSGKSFGDLPTAAMRRGEEEEVIAELKTL